MKTSKFTEEQVAYALRLSESGTPVSDVCRQLGISEATFYVWRKKYADLGVAELRRLRQLTEENARPKRIVADLTLDKQILQEVIKNKIRRQRAGRRWHRGSTTIRAAGSSARSSRWKTSAPCCRKSVSRTAFAADLSAIFSTRG